MKSGCVLFSALLLFCAGVTESVLVDEYSMQLTVRALLGEEMRVHDKKIADLEKQMEKQELRLEQQRAEAKAETEKQQLRIDQQQSQIEKQQLQIEQQRVEMKEQRAEAEKQRAEIEQRHSQELRDQRQEFREAIALVPQTVADTQAGFAGKLASSSKPQCDVSKIGRAHV